MTTMNILIITLLVCLATGFVDCRKKAFTAQVVEDIVQNEIARKMPAAMNGSKTKKKSLTGVHLKEATDAINKLVDESIVDRVQEAEKEVSQMLLKSIEHHIQDAGKVLLKQDENTCRDKLDSCATLAEAGVCESSKDAMVNNCPMTCNFCGMLEDLKNQGKIQKEEVKPVKTKKKQKHRKKLKKHKKKHRHVVKNSNLVPEEVRLIHENMLDQTIDHANLPMAVSEGQNIVENTEGTDSREYEADEAAAAAQAQAQQVQAQQAQAQEEKDRKEREEEELLQRREQQRKKKAAHKQYKTISAQNEKGNYLPPNPAGMDPTTPNIQAVKAEQARLTGPTNAFQNADFQNRLQAATNDVMNTATAMYSQYVADAPNTIDATKRNDFTDTKLLKKKQPKNALKSKEQNKDTQSTIINKLMKVDLNHSKTKTDLKLKHEIETMVDKAFGELLLKKRR